jgi:hypothetical protein
MSVCAPIGRPFAKAPLGGGGELVDGGHRHATEPVFRREVSILIAIRGELVLHREPKIICVVC